MTRHGATSIRKWLVIQAGVLRVAPLAVACLSVSCGNPVPACGDGEFYGADEHGGKCVRWSAVAWRETVQDVLANMEPAVPTLSEAADSSRALPDPGRIAAAHALLTTAERELPDIPFAVGLSEAPGHHEAWLQASEAVGTLRRGTALVMTGEDATPEDIRSARAFLNQGLRYFRRAQRLLTSVGGEASEQ